MIQPPLLPRRSPRVHWTSGALLCLVVACGGIAQEPAGDRDTDPTTASSGDTEDRSTETTQSSGSTGDTATTQSSGETTSETTSETSTTGPSTEDTGETTGDTSGDGEDPHLPGPLCPTEEGPGKLLTDLAVTGAGPCQDVDLGSFLETLREQYIEQRGATWSGGDDGEYADYYAPVLTAYLSEDGQFRVISAHGEGDCPSGCIEDYWTYFESDASCQPKQLGTVMRTFGDGCIEQEGETRWGIPATRATDQICGQEIEEHNLAGSYTLPFTGRLVPCSRDAKEAEDISGFLAMQAQYDSEDPSVLLVQLASEDVDLGWLGEQVFRLAVDGYIASGYESTSDSTCIEQHEAELFLDFAACDASRVHHFEVLDAECSGDYCKGDLELEVDLSEISLEQ